MVGKERKKLIKLIQRYEFEKMFSIFVLTNTAQNLFSKTTSRSQRFLFSAGPRFIRKYSSNLQDKTNKVQY